MNKTIDTLIPDIKDLINGRIDLTEDFEAVMIEMSEQYSMGLLSRLREQRRRYLASQESEVSSSPRSSFRLRASNLGKPARQLWYQAQGFERSPFPPNIAFLGDNIEVFALTLARLAGHEVTLQQAEVDVHDGVVGHIDCVIDGELVDVKSTQSLVPFQQGLNDDNDRYGYRRQLSAYAYGMGLPRGFIWAVNKATLEMALTEVPCFEDDDFHVDQLRAQVESDEIPERCYSDQKKTTKGENRVVDKRCKFCDFKQHCWSDANDGEGLRVFAYAQGPEYFTHVADDPTTTSTGKKTKIREITDEVFGDG